MKLAWLLVGFGCLFVTAGCRSSGQSDSTPLAARPSANPHLGSVCALLIVGKVDLVDRDGHCQPLARGTSFTEGETVKVGKDSGVLLAFSNGAIIKLKEYAELAIDQLEQEPFNEANEGTFLRLQRDPSKSVTRLDLRNGFLAGEVRALNIAAGSVFEIATPAGSVAVHGTIFFLSVSRTPTGEIKGIALNCPIGSFDFMPAPGVQAACTSSSPAGVGISPASVNVRGGATVLLTLTTDSSGKITGVNITGARLTNAEVQQQVNQLVNAIHATRIDESLSPMPPPTVTGPLDIRTVDGEEVTYTVQLDSIDLGTSEFDPGTC
ncbi:MAG TPA: hypothetical protein VHC95_08275 [Opitutales bacterium]|nr:hypothetical protein [Opitutales bacterium]